MSEAQYSEAAELKIKKHRNWKALNFISLELQWTAMPNAWNKSMSYWLALTLYPYSIAVPYSRGGRSEAQQNNSPFITTPVFRNIVDLAFSIVFSYVFPWEVWFYHIAAGTYILRPRWDNVLHVFFEGKKRQNWIHREAQNNWK